MDTFNQTSSSGDIWRFPMNSTVFFDGFASSFSVTVLSELGDRTFFIAAILAIKHSRLLVILGQMLAQTIMTVASVALGFAAHFVPRYVTHYLSILLFSLFGAKLIYEIRDWLRCRKMDVEDEEAIRSDLEESTAQRSNNRRWYTSAFITAFTMTLVAEWGDRSQISTILLSATKDLYAVTLGTLIGHALCTILAVMSGRAIASYIPVHLLTLVGALLFFAFAIISLIHGYEETPIQREVYDHVTNTTI